MKLTLETLLAELSAQATSDHFSWICQDFVDVVGERDDLGAPEVLEPLLHFMEAHPDADYGLPGALVHFLEGLDTPEYVPRLADSLGRTPTMSTLWMAQRQLNGTPSAGARVALLEVLDDLSGRPQLAVGIRDEVARVLASQARR